MPVWSGVRSPESWCEHKGCRRCVLNEGIRDVLGVQLHRYIGGGAPPLRRAIHHRLWFQPAKEQSGNGCWACAEILLISWKCQNGKYFGKNRSENLSQIFCELCGFRQADLFMYAELGWLCLCTQSWDGFAYVHKAGMALFVYTELGWLCLCSLHKARNIFSSISTEICAFTRI